MFKARLKKHWSTRKGKISIIALCFIFVFLIYSALVFVKGHILSQSSVQMSDEAQTNTNTHQLSNDEFAIITTTAGKPTGKMVTHAIKLLNGDTFSYAADQNTAVNYVDGSNANTYIKLSSNVTIHKKDELISNSSKKIDTAIGSKLKKVTDTAPVIIKFTVPYGRFYERSQTTARAADKITKFNAIRDKVVAKFSSNSHKKNDLHIINGISAEVDQQTLSDLANNPDVSSVELDRTVSATLDQSVPQIQADQVWQQVSSSGQPLTGTGETIAIIDTGVDYTHPDLGGCIGPTCKVIGGYDFVNNDTNPMDDMGHGTHVAGIAAGKGLLNGVAPDAKILAVKVLDSGGSGSWSQVIAGINYAVDPNGDGNPSDHVNVASMSLGGAGNPDDAVSTAVDSATAAGVVFTIAAGNSGPTASTIMSPGTARTAITVAASCKTGDIGVNGYCTNPIASFSSRGPLVWNGVDLQKPDVAAPGVSICSARWGSSFSTSPTCFDSRHVRLSGTSMATPHVAGLAALVLEAYPNDTPDQVKQLLKSTARNLGMTTNDQGAGEINAKTAIPVSQSAAATPASWSVASDPTKKLGYSMQTFSVSSEDSSIASLTPQYDNTIPGVSITFSKTSLLPTDSFDATTTVDNDTAKPGNYLSRIDLLSNGVIKATIPVFITVKPTLTITPGGTVDYGIDVPSLSSWNSDTKTFTLTNLRTDIAQTVTLASSTFASGITYNMPSSVSVPANGSTSVNTSFAVTNSSIADNIYTGTLTFTSPTVTLSVGTKFVKFFEIVVQDTANPADLSHTFPTVVHYSGGKVYTDYSGDSPKIFYVTDPGTYDVISRFLYAPSNGGDNTDVKEGITVNSAITTVDLKIADATNLVQTNPITATGQTGYVLNYDDKFVNGQNVMYETFGGGTNNQYFSNMSGNYGEQRLLVSFQPSINMYYWYFTFAGLSGNKTLTNSPADFKSMKVKWDLDPQKVSASPVLFARNGWASTYNAVYYNNQPLSLPFTQTIYSMLPSTYQFYDWDNNSNSGFTGSALSTYFHIDDSLTRRTYGGDAVPNMTEPVVYQGLGPSVWMGMLQVSKSAVTLESEVWRQLFTLNLGSSTPGFFRQDYTTLPYDSQPYSIYQGTTLISTGTIPGFGTSSTSLAAINLPKPGTYIFQTTFPYKDKGISLAAQVKDIFNSKNSTDPNPPAFKRLNVFSNNVRSEIYDPTVANKVEFEVDPVSGTMGAVSVSFSSDGINFQPVSVTNNNGIYDATLPQVAASVVSVKITAKDSVSNELDYTFQLPQGTAPVSVVSPAPTTTVLTPTPTPNGITPNPTPALGFNGVQATNITTTQALVTWSTVSPPTSTQATPGTTQVKYGLSSTALTQTTPFDSTLLTFHSVTLTGLTANTTYYYQLLSNNLTGYPYSSSIYSFTTKRK